jgi:hypothetical protein
MQRVRDHREALALNGYWESSYVVDREVDITTKAGGAQHIEVRQRTAHSKLPYISVEGTDATGKQILDLLYIYDHLDKLEQDWAKLISDVVVRREDLEYVEVVVWHATGYGKDGSVTMY